jgi:two-component system sensor kinase
MLLNINERKQAEKALRRLNQELQQKTSELALAYKDMESFSYSISHDLRAPLRIMGGLSDMVLKDYYDKLDDEGKKLLNAIQGQAERMDKLILALLTLSKVGRQEMAMADIDMEKEARLIAADLKAAAPERKIEITIDHLQPARGDITLIRQVLTNLLSNAVKFTKAKNLALIVVGGSGKGSEDIYYVKDNGIGFDMAYANKLFRVFQRIHSEKEFEGIGIGLTIVERIIRRHGGRVWAEGTPHEGATFYFSLPRKIS